MFLFVGCAASKGMDDMTVGTTDYHYRAFEQNNTKFEVGNYFKSNTSSCIDINDTFDIRLDTQIFNQDFDGFFENASEGAIAGFNSNAKDTNEIGVFLTIEELARVENNQTEYENIQNRLIYTSFPRKKNQPLNQRNKLIYTGKNTGNDLRLILEVREFDAQNGEAIIDLLNLLSNEGSKYLHNTGNKVVGNLVDKFGSIAKKSLFKDDVISYFDMEFVPCGVYQQNKQLYLREGQFVFVRHPQTIDFKRYQNLGWDSNNSTLFYDNNLSKKINSFTSIQIYKRNR
jgi:hypothetical protein